MATVPRPPPTEEMKVLYRRNHAAGMLFKNMHDAQPPEKGVTKSARNTNIIWDKKVQRYRYTKGANIFGGEKLGGRFTSGPKRRRVYEKTWRSRK
jgi:hypothetical protein